jgi:hypothetical protein
MLPIWIRCCWLAICLWDIWGWRFAYHSEVFGLRESQISWYLTGIFIISLTSTVLAIGWGLSRFSRVWGFCFWLSYLLLYIFSAPFQSSGHQFFFIVLPFLFLLPIEDTSEDSLRESTQVIRAFTYILALLCLNSALTIILSGGFDGHIFDSYLSLNHAFNHWLARSTTTFPWGYCWSCFLLVMSALLFYGNWRCRTWASYGLFLWGFIILTLFQMFLLGCMLILTALLLWQTSWKKIRYDTKQSAQPIFALHRFPLRSAFAWFLCLLLVFHLMASWLNLRPLQRVPETIGYNSQWDPFAKFQWYPNVTLEGRHHGVWKPLIGKQGDRSWNTIEDTLLIVPALSQFPPSQLSPELRRRFETMILRWRIEWGENIDRYRLISISQEDEFIHQETPYLPRQFEGSRSRD